MATVTYDPTVIQKFANKLYGQANTTIAVYTVLGLMVGGGGGYAIGDGRSSTRYAFIGAVALGVLGIAIGTARAFMLKLQAQTALCQMKIEENTRR